MAEHCVLLRGGELTALVGDDCPRGVGGQQYSGLWALWHKQLATSPFQAAYAVWQEWEAFRACYPLQDNEH